jgi:hypothetical protein
MITEKIMEFEKTLKIYSQNFQDCESNSILADQLEDHIAGLGLTIIPVLPVLLDRGLTNQQDIVEVFKHIRRVINQIKKIKTPSTNTICVVETLKLYLVYVQHMNIRNN